MKGNCLCGAIQVIAPEQKEVGLCHCSMCRRWSGGPTFAVVCESGVEFIGDNPKIYHSSEWAERGFCAKCGTHIFYRQLHSSAYIIPAGLFNEQNFHLNTEIFIDQKPSFYEFKNETLKLTSQQVSEQFKAQ